PSSPEITLHLSRRFFSKSMNYHRLYPVSSILRWEKCISNSLFENIKSTPAIRKDKVPNDIFQVVKSSRIEQILWIEFKSIIPQVLNNFLREFTNSFKGFTNFIQPGLLF